MDEYINIVGFRTATPDKDGPQATSGDFIKINSDGFSFYYERNKHSLYITNMYGCDRPDWHYDYWITVNENVLFETDFADIVFDRDEKLEPSKGEDGGEGKTGIKAGNKLSEIYAQGKVKVPDALTDEHYVFDGFYEDAEFQHLIWKPGETTNWTMPNHETNIYCKWVPPVRKVEFHDGTDKNNYQPYYYDGDLIHDVTYQNQIPSEYAPPTDNKPGYRFVSFYYYKDKTAKNKDDKTWFDPINMTMPFED